MLFETTPVYRRRTTRDLRASGMRKRDIAAAVADGRLIRPRIGSYLDADAPEDVQEAVSIGGRLGCLSALASRGVFVKARHTHHLHLSHSSSRMRHKRGDTVWHWDTLTRMPDRQDTRIHIIDALVQSTWCQGPRAWIASLDSALHQHLIGQEDLDVIFSGLPRAWRRLRRLLDGRAESGPETLVRLMARGLGFSIRLQEVFIGIGRVDLLLDGWLVVECDSKAYHASWEQQLVDRRRDQQLAAKGYSVYRPVAEDILFRPELVIAALRGLRASRPPASA